MHYLLPQKETSFSLSLGRSPSQRPSSSTCPPYEIPIIPFTRQHQPRGRDGVFSNWLQLQWQYCPALCTRSLHCPLLTVRRRSASTLLEEKALIFNFELGFLLFSWSRVTKFNEIGVGRSWRFGRNDGCPARIAAPRVPVPSDGRGAREPLPEAEDQRPDSVGDRGHPCGWCLQVRAVGSPRYLTCSLLLISFF